jgi:plasmid replication initiation protein
VMAHVVFLDLSKQIRGSTLNQVTSSFFDVLNNSFFTSMLTLEATDSMVLRLRLDKKTNSVDFSPQANHTD